MAAGNALCGTKAQQSYRAHLREQVYPSHEAIGRTSCSPWRPCLLLESLWLNVGCLKALCPAKSDALLFVATPAEQAHCESSESSHEQQAFNCKPRVSANSLHRRPTGFYVFRAPAPYRRLALSEAGHLHRHCRRPAAGQLLAACREAVRSLWPTGTVFSV